MSNNARRPDLIDRLARLERRIDKLEGITHSADAYFGPTDEEAQVTIGDLRGDEELYGIRVKAPNGADSSLWIDQYGTLYPFSHIACWRSNEYDTVTNTSAAEYWFADSTCTASRIFVQTYASAITGTLTTTVTWQADGTSETSLGTYAMTSPGSDGRTFAMPNTYDDIGVHGRIRMKFHVTGGSATATVRPLVLRWEYTQP